MQAIVFSGLCLAAASTQFWSTDARLIATANWVTAILAWIVFTGGILVLIGSVIKPEPKKSGIWRTVHRTIVGGTWVAAAAFAAYNGQTVEGTLIVLGVMLLAIAREAAHAAAKLQAEKGETP